MAIPFRRPSQPAAALAVGLSFALAAPAARPAQPAMLDAGSESGYTFTIEAGTVARDGDKVRFRLLATSDSGADHVDSAMEVDCAHRTRRQLTATYDDGHGKVDHYGAEMASTHVVSQGTRADRELRQMCARVGLAAAEPPHLPAPASDLVDVGSDAGGAHAIFIDSVQRRGALVDYMLQTIAPGQAGNAARRQFIVDCDRRLRAAQVADAPEGTRVPARRVVAASREERELAAACAMPEGPRQRWFAGFVVRADGVVVAPHARTVGCDRIAMGVGAQRRTLQLIANEEDITLLRIPGGDTWTPLPAAATVDVDLRPHQAVTVLGVSGVAPRVSAAFVEEPGTNSVDSGWPQVRTLKDRAMPEGVVWNASGRVIGFALAVRPPDVHGGTALVRMLPIEQVRQRLTGHAVGWRGEDRNPLAPDAAMRAAMRATVPLICQRTP